MADDATKKLEGAVKRQKLFMEKIRKLGKELQQAKAAEKPKGQAGSPEKSQT